MVDKELIKPVLLMIQERAEELFYKSYEAGLDFDQPMDKAYMLMRAVSTVVLELNIEYLGRDWEGRLSGNGDKPHHVN